MYVSSSQIAFKVHLIIIYQYSRSTKISIYRITFRLGSKASTALVYDNHHHTHELTLLSIHVRHVLLCCVVSRNNLGGTVRAMLKFLFTDDLLK